MRLLVVIPTWNRAEYLDKAISSVAAARSRARNVQVDLFISDGCSSDHTPDVVARWQRHSPWIHGRRWDTAPHTWSEILRRVLLGSGLDYDYLWILGDDDWICDTTAFGQLAEALEASGEDLPAIVHCCQARRAWPDDKRIIAGSTEDLCNTYGWHELLGWISSLVLSRDTVERMTRSPQLDMEIPSAFAHSEALLEAGYGRTMLVLAAGLVDLQEKEQTPECMKRWAEGGVGERYWNIIPGLLNLKQRGVLTTPLTVGFFRYHTYSFWDRFSVELMSLAYSAEASGEFLESKLRLLVFFGALLGYGEDRKLYESWLEGFTDDVWEVRRALQLIERRINSAQKPSYKFNILPPPNVTV